MCVLRVLCVLCMACSQLTVTSPTPRQQIVQSKKQSVNIELGCYLSQIITLQNKSKYYKV